MKICTKCGLEKGSSEFHKNKKSRDGLRYWCKACCLVHQNSYRTTERNRDNHLRRSYGITTEDYESILESQNRVCAICEEPGGDSGNDILNVDHNHETNAVRGLLCINCNRGLGQFKDDPELCYKAFEYLKRNGS